MDKVIKRGLAGAAVAGAALIGGALYVMQERQTEEPDFRAIRTDGDFQIREYGAITVAETVVQGPRQAALSAGFGIIADYIFAKSRPGETIAMTVPVVQDSGDPMASEPPMFDDELEGAWRTRFVMPAGRTADDLPTPPDAIELVDLPPRKVAVVSFSGRADDRMLAEAEDRLRGWLARNGEKSAAEPEYAFYNSPMIPGPLRRNEVWLVLG
ncbi:heme-binding protein [Sphingomonas sp.]|uniref:SOUL family heme-binding protein n=1 Tax=Sphingomonas sp. TaxID=28214 RepID=UPI00286AFD6F|nr:heme-binding protein [Sphingomonas sp.]